ncbi:MAG: hypothetical protein U0264_01980 [Candidatus Kapaibacterium sp.]
MKTVAFLDLLGFKNYVKKDISGASELLSDYNEIIKNKIHDQTYHPQLLDKNIKLCIDSFETFLPCSDSIFITSKDPNRFVEQVSHLLSDSFLINSEQYRNPVSHLNLLEVSIPNLGGAPNERKTVEHYPVLFRGGVSFGEAYVTENSSIVNGELIQSANLIGKAVIEAIGLEKPYKGPRLICNSKFVDQLSVKIKDKYIGTIKLGELYEIYWTSSIYHDQNDPKLEIGDFSKLFVPAVNLWKALNHYDYGIHYFEYMKLIIKGTIQYFSTRNCEEMAIDYIKNTVEGFELGEKWEDLVN